MNNKNLLNILFLSALSFFISNKAIADIYCPQTLYCVKGTCKPNEENPDFKYFSLSNPNAPTNGKYIFQYSNFYQKNTSYSGTFCGYKQHEKSLSLKAITPLYPDFTNPDNNWYTEDNDYKGNYKCYGDSKSCPLQLNPSKFLKHK
jgi:hypothetical protein